MLGWSSWLRYGMRSTTIRRLELWNERIVGAISSSMPVSILVFLLILTKFFYTQENKAYILFKAKQNCTVTIVKSSSLIYLKASVCVLEFFYLVVRTIQANVGRHVLLVAHKGELLMVANHARQPVVEHEPLVCFLHLFHIVISIHFISIHK